MLRSSSNTARFTILSAASLLCAGVAMWMDRDLDRQLSAHQVPSELIYLPSNQFLSAVSLGYRHALADVLWFRTISYFGRHYRSDRLYPWLAKMCDVVTDLDPRAEHVYRFGGVILPWEANRIDDGIALLEKGARNVPESWHMHYMLGFSYYFFKDDLAASSQSLRAATLLPDAPEFVSRLAAVVYAAHQGHDNAIEFLQELDRTDVSDEVRAAIHERIRELSLARDIETLETAIETFRQRFDHMPLDLTELIAAGILASMPAEPFGGVYILDATSGRVRSSLGHIPSRLGSSKIRESLLKGRAGQ